MTARPYDATLRKDGDLRFQADLPAFARIGRHFAEVKDAIFDFSYAQVDLDRWSAYVDAIQNLAAAVKRDPDGARAIVAEFHRDHPPTGDAALDCIPDQMLGPATITHDSPSHYDILAAVARMTLNLRNMHPSDTDRLLQGPEAWDPFRAIMHRGREDWLPPGSYWFHCGPGPELSPGQKQSFDELEDNQTALSERVAEKLCAMYASAADAENLTDPLVQITYPKDVAADAALDRFRIVEFHLVDGERIGIEFDSMFRWGDGFGCAATICHGRVEMGGQDQLGSPHRDDEHDDGDDEDRDDWDE